MLLAVPFIEIRGKQKITMVSICDKKEILKNFSLIVKRYKRPPKIARREVTHNFSFSHSAFSRPTHFLRKKPWGRGRSCIAVHQGGIPVLCINQRLPPGGHPRGHWGICPNAHSNLIKSPWVNGRGILTNPLAPGCNNKKQCSL